jgi:hypothetical protein
MGVKRLVQRVHGKLGRNRLAGDESAGTLCLVNDAGIISRSEVFPQFAAHLRGKVCGIECVFHSNRQALERAWLASVLKAFGCSLRPFAQAGFAETDPGKIFILGRAGAAYRLFR